MEAIKRDLLLPADIQAPTVAVDLQTKKVRFVDLDKQTEVCAKTSEYLDLYLSNCLVKKGEAENYLGNKTLKYLMSVQTGFFTLFDKSKRLLDEEVKELIRASRLMLRNPSLESNQAFNHSLAVFSLMKNVTDIAPDDVLNKTKSLRACLTVPSTTMEYYGRYKEMTNIIVHLTTDMENGVNVYDLRRKPAVLRTFAYFKTASVLPLRMDCLPPIPGEKPRVNEEEKDKFEKLLAGIDISLN